MQFINWNLARNPLNYLVVGSMALLGIVLVSLIAAPKRAAQPAQ